MNQSILMIQSAICMNMVSSTHCRKPSHTEINLPAFRRLLHIVDDYTLATPKLNGPPQVPGQPQDDVFY